MKTVVHSTYLNFDDIEFRIVQLVVDEMHIMADEILADTKRMWSGWKYKDRPSGYRNISQKAWKIAVEPSGTGAVIVLRNDAIDWRAAYYASKGKGGLAAKYKNRPYVFAPGGNPPIWVSRTKMGHPELFKVLEMIETKHSPELEKRIAQRIVNEARNSPRTSKKASKSPSVQRVIAKLLSPFRRS
tara:strand:+ start:2591 stop:3148 length:558 start_codon:yes stop_codon:yes gene_type:complete